MGFKLFSNILCPTYYALKVVKANTFREKIEELQQFFINKII